MVADYLNTTLHSTMCEYKAFADHPQMSIHHLDCMTLDPILITDMKPEFFDQMWCMY